MAQAYVLRNDLVIEDAQNPVRVRSVYNDPTLPIEYGGPDCTAIWVDTKYIHQDRAAFRTLLTSNWREDYKSVLQQEASRRINLVFPEFKQRNYTAQYQSYITQYGADANVWPQDAKDFKGEYDRAWKYVNDVRTASNAWTAMPTDPTADNIWPPTITPIK